MFKTIILKNIYTKATVRKHKFNKNAEYIKNNHLNRFFVFKIIIILRDVYTKVSEKKNIYLIEYK